MKSEIVNLMIKNRTYIMGILNVDPDSFLMVANGILWTML